MTQSLSQALLMGKNFSKGKIVVSFDLTPSVMRTKINPEILFHGKEV